MLNDVMLSAVTRGLDRLLGAVCVNEEGGWIDGLVDK